MAKAGSPASIQNDAEEPRRASAVDAISRDSSLVSDCPSLFSKSVDHVRKKAALCRMGAAFVSQAAAIVGDRAALWSMASDCISQDAAVSRIDVAVGRNGVASCRHDAACCEIAAGVSRKNAAISDNGEEVCEIDAAAFEMGAAACTFDAGAGGHPCAGPSPGALAHEQNARSEDGRDARRHRKAGVVMTTTTRTDHRSIVVLKLPTRVPALITYGQNIVKSLTASGACRAAHGMRTTRAGH